MIKEGNSLVQDQRDGSGLFADYFTTMTGSVQTQTQSPGVHPCTTKIESRGWANTEFSFRNMSHSEVLTALQHLNPHKATGHDLIPPIVLRMVASEISATLTQIYNQIIDHGMWPKDWKKGECTPVFKKDDPLSKSNYRPVTVLTTVDKVFEQLLSKQLTVLTDRIYDPFIGSAYRKRHSCEITLVRLVED